MFQTASLYSVEVDYYNFGTCEITKGAYFCGDHSCNTFKHVGSGKGSGVYMENRVRNYDIYKRHSPAELPNFWGAADNRARLEEVVQAASCDLAHQLVLHRVERVRAL